MPSRAEARTIRLPGAVSACQAIDLYDPAPATSGSPAGKLAVLFVHGGGWYAGERSSYAGWAAHAAELGHPAGTVGYRTEEGTDYREKLADVLAGWRLLGAEHPDAEGVCLVGSSAGAHLVTALALCGDAPCPSVPAGRADLLPLWGVVSMNGPGSMRPENLLRATERLVQLGLTADEIDLLDAPVTVPGIEWLFLNAEDETYFPHQHVAALAGRLRAAGHRTETVVVPGTAHGFGYQVLRTGDHRAELSDRAVTGLWSRAERSRARDLRR